MASSSPAPVSLELKNATWVQIIKLLESFESSKKVVKVKDFESERVTSKHRHENKSCSVCQESERESEIVKE